MSSPIKNEVDQQYGYWTVLSFVDSIGTKGARWECVCQCGNKKILYGSSLRSGASTACGKCGVNKKKMPNDSALRKAYSRVKDIHRRERGFPLDELIPMEHYKQLVFQNCFYCDAPPNSVRNSFSVRKVNPVHDQIVVNGIDRVESSKGYTIDNCVTCCPWCNTMKTDKSQQEFYQQIGKIYEKYTKSLVPSDL